MNLSQTIAYRLRAGATVVIVQEADELLAIASVEAAAEAAAKAVGGEREQIRIMSASDRKSTTELAKHAVGRGTLVLLDYLALFGENPLSIRTIREVALQQPEEGEAFSRLILIEQPTTKIPPSGAREWCGSAGTAATRRSTSGTV